MLFRSGYGLGDGVQVSSVLRHVVKERPHWKVDYQAEEGKHQVGRGIVSATFAYGEPYPSDHYDAEVQIILYDTWANWHDRPNTRVSSCLHEQFGIKWRPDCARYVVNVSEGVKRWASDAVPKRAVAFHYQGDSDKPNKDLLQTQADKIYNHILFNGHNPYKLGRHIPKGYDAEVNCAIIGQCKAFVGIDSGPSKCASATDTPALVIWTGHHPAPFHDPAPNTTHLVPVGYHGLKPVCNNKDVIAWFEAHYTVRYYTEDPVEEANNWLSEVLK